MHSLKNGKVGFKQLDASKTGIEFKNYLSEKAVTKNRLFLGGSGVAAGDIDGDGLPDLYFTSIEGPNV
ncbi:MAG TPA: FG-GAP repeat protein, partial [Balneolaceae bacterium]|nr:FG-GAP repeat protein [Balneolaceae bacterium]